MEKKKNPKKSEIKEITGTDQNTYYQLGDYESVDLDGAEITFTGTVDEDAVATITGKTIRRPMLTANPSHQAHPNSLNLASGSSISSGTLATHINPFNPVHEPPQKASLVVSGCTFEEEVTFTYREGEPVLLQNCIFKKGVVLKMIPETSVEDAIKGLQEIEKDLA